MTDILTEVQYDEGEALITDVETESSTPSPVDGKLQRGNSKVLKLLQQRKMHYPFCYCGCTVKFANSK